MPIRLKAERELLKVLHVFEIEHDHIGDDKVLIPRSEYDRLIKLVSKICKALKR